MTQTKRLALALRFKQSIEKALAMHGFVWSDPHSVINEGSVDFGGKIACPCGNTEEFRQRQVMYDLCPAALFHQWFSSAANHLFLDKARGTGHWKDAGRKESSLRVQYYANLIAIQGEGGST